ncbi:unnamed protein product [Ilex paraguariensis]|uniref:Nuclear transcription factor Y subunit n=1 Tax=Ilex paraguariensis TaxID=185542 RepID=A0ABC8T5I8_9AQUA
MQSKSKNANRLQADSYNIPSSTLCSDPWWHGTGYNSISPAVVRGNASDSSSMEHSMNGQSRSDGGLNEDDDDANKESQSTALPRSDGSYGQEHQNFQHVTSNLPPRSDESLTQPPQLELVGHSIACASNPYSNQFYGGMMAPYGQPMVHPTLFDMHHARMPLPIEVARDPVFVNAKQYHGIMRRRQSRAKAELEKKLVKARKFYHIGENTPWPISPTHIPAPRGPTLGGVMEVYKPYLHESRHQHAMRRERGSGGRFAKKSDVDTSKTAPADKVTGSGAAGSSSSSGSEPLPTCEEHTNVNDAGRSGNQNSSRVSTYQVDSAERGDGGSSGQQWGCIATNQASQRAVAMQ